MFGLGLLIGLVVGALWMLGARIVVKMRRDNVAGTPSAPHNSRYMAALQAMDEFSNGGLLSH